MAMKPAAKIEPVKKLNYSGKKLNFEKYNRFGYLFLAPFFIVFFIFNFYPTIYTIFLSFTDLSGWATTPNFVGLENYTNIINNEFFIKALSNTLLLWTMNFIPQILIALFLAYTFTNKRLHMKGTGFFKAVFYLPNIITAASIALIFYALFSYPQGPINLLLQDIGLLKEPFDFFRSETGTRLIVAFIQFWMWYGQTTIVLVAAILSIDESLFEAARVDGANERQTFFKITLPLMKPMIIYILITSMIGGLQMFDIPLLLTNGQPNNSVETIMTFIYKQAFQGSRAMNVASTASVILLIISIIFSFVVFRMFRDRGQKGRG
jgi:ABC-type sugar transport system permease subunit